MFYHEKKLTGKKESCLKISAENFENRFAISKFLILEGYESCRKSYTVSDA
jgi:hypothetical protein